MIIYSKLLLFTGAITVNQNLIIIRKKYEFDMPLLKHEQVHQAQMAKLGTLTFWWCYTTSKAFRLAVEIEAYKVQIAKGAVLEVCAKRLVEGYWLGLTQDQAVKLLAA